jgi:small-conductance mechanosensitive channel
MAEFTGSLVRGLIWALAAVFVFAEISAAFGLGSLISDSIASFFAVNAGRIGVMFVLVVAGYVAARIVTIVFSEYKRHTKLDTLTIDLFQNVVRYLVYAVVAVMLLTNLLVMAGLQTLAGTLVTLFTVFVGLVVSFAATGSIGNALSGIVVMSWRPFKEGDRVEVAGGTYGDVQEVNIMFTKIKTIKDEIIHVPNSQVLANKIVNYSESPNVIVHQEVTIGYDVPRTRVEELLLKAVVGIDNLLTEPKPFVLVRNLDNNYVAYEINAYTDKPNQLINTYSQLMKSTLDLFGKAGIEILSPQHIALRKSNPTVSRKRTHRTT